MSISQTWRSGYPGYVPSKFCAAGIVGKVGRIHTKGISHAFKPPGNTSSKSQNCSTGLQTLSKRGYGASDYDQKKLYLSSEKSGSCASSRGRREALRPNSISGTLAVSQLLIWGACKQRLAQRLHARQTKFDRSVEIVSVRHRRFMCCAVHQRFKSALFRPRLGYRARQRPLSSGAGDATSLNSTP